MSPRRCARCPASTIRLHGPQPRSESRLSRRSSRCRLIAECLAHARYAADARPAEMRAGDPLSRLRRVLENLHAGCAGGCLIVVIAPAERGIAELQVRHM